MYFECHITIEPKFRDKVEIIAKQHKFKVSALVGDEIMGDDKLIYCTCHDTDEDSITSKMQNLVLDLQNISILRKKIEHIILDVRYGK